MAEHLKVSRWRGTHGRSWLLLGAVAAGSLATAVLYGPVRDWLRADRCGELSTSNVDLVRRCMVAGFQGAYPEVVSPTGIVREFSITAAPTTIEMFDGRPFEVWAYNDQVPGPTLRVKLGDTLRVHFRNNLPQPSTIHWHGVRVPNAMDGVPGVTQEPVPPGGTFDYEFTPKDAGTFWFHPHIRSSEQVERGLFGVLIVEDPAPDFAKASVSSEASAPPAAREMIWVLDDWLLSANGSLDTNFVTRHDLAHDGRWGNLLTVNGRSRPVFEARPGEKLRVRTVDVANGRVFSLDFGELPATVIAMDGMYLPEPIPSQGIELAPGNRADFDISIPAEASGTYPILNRFGRAPVEMASIVVAGAPVSPSTQPYPIGRVPDWSDARDLAPEYVFGLNARLGGPYGVEWTLNDKVMRHEATGHDHSSAPYVLESGRFVKLRFANLSARLHPMHIHGQFFQVLARNGTDVREPRWRDTVLLRPRETIDVGMVPMDPGKWMLHCHILEHADSGMMTLVEVR